MKYLVIDDEPIAHRIIEGYCADLPYMEKVGNAYSALEASGIVQEHEVDLIFLDINMPRMTGFEWLRTMSTTPAVIVTTAYQDYALEAFELEVTDYLLKPFSFTRFLQAVNKVKKTTVTVQETRIESDPNDGGSRFFVKGDKKYHQIYYRDILYIEAYGNYSKIYLEDEMILCHEKISDFTKTLPNDNFLRIHKSYIIALAKIKLIQGNEIYIDQCRIPIGQTYRSQVSRLLARK